VSVFSRSESFQTHFNEQFYKSQPHIKIFLKVLITNVQNNVYIQIQPQKMCAIIIRSNK